jgi:2,3-bisphosphoglycerate-independent phosphoglycerate mutase
MVYRGSNFDNELTSPYDIIDKPIGKYLPRGRHGKILSRIMEQAAKILQRHPVNQVRLELGENQASNIWLWGQGRQGQLESFHRRFGQRGAVITGVDLLRGLARLMGIKIVQVEGATGYLDTNYQGKGEAALAALAENDLVLVHAAAPDEAGHEHLAAEKVEAVEKIDKYIVGPLLKELQGQKNGRIMVLPDHPTPIGRRTHTKDPVPFALAGAEIVGNGQESFSEVKAAESGFRIEKGYELMEYFLKVKR